MDFLLEFNRIMAEQTEIALATCLTEQPNVRIVNFYYNPENSGVLYFATFRRNRKIKEFAGNDKVAFTTVPHGSTEHIRVTEGQVKKSGFTIFDLQKEFTEKIPGYGDTIEHAGKSLDLYEICFKNAKVVLDMMKSGKVSF